MWSSPLLLAAIAGLAHAWLPSNGQNGTDSTLSPRWLLGSTIRGVNLGAMFILEPWMAGNEWSIMGCGDAASEFDCVVQLGQDAANSAFQAHWARWIVRDDLVQMQSYGLNTIRVPVGYWMREDLVSDSEHFPQGGLPYLEQLCGWASDLGFYIIMDLHGAPGAQVAGNADTGQNAAAAGFYDPAQYERGYKFLEWMANLIHTNSNYRNVGSLAIVNEPEQGDAAASMIAEYYPTSFARIRAAESALGVARSNYLHIQMMNSLWGSGDPTSGLTDDYYASYDDHRYLKWDPSVTQTRDGILSASCSDNRGSNSPTIVGEWSLSVGDDVQYGGELDPSSYGAIQWYQQWWAAQVIAYEKQAGWIFWSWKADLADWRWSYQAAVAAGVIPTDPGQAYSLSVC